MCRLVGQMTWPPSNRAGRGRSPVWRNSPGRWRSSKPRARAPARSGSPCSRRGCPNPPNRSAARPGSWTWPSGPTTLAIRLRRSPWPQRHPRRRRRRPGPAPSSGRGSCKGGPSLPRPPRPAARPGLLLLGRKQVEQPVVAAGQNHIAGSILPPFSRGRFGISRAFRRLYGHTVRGKGRSRIRALALVDTAPQASTASPPWPCSASRMICVQTRGAALIFSRISSLFFGVISSRGCPG